MYRYIIFFLLALMILACSLDRSNPLDPQNNDIEIPNKVVINPLPLVSIGVVHLTWERQNSVAVGYYIYRSMSHNGLYERIGTYIPADEDSLGTYDDYDEDLENETWYYYKVSGYNVYGLEGYRSNYVYTNFLERHAE